MPFPLSGPWRRFGLGPRFYVILAAALAGVVGAVYLGLSLGNPEMATLMMAVLRDLLPAVVGVILVGAIAVVVVTSLFDR